MATQLDPVYVGEEPTEAENPSLGSTEAAPDTGVSLARPVIGPPLDEATADRRAKKVKEGLGKHVTRSVEEVRQDIMSGKEEAIRREAASKLDYENALRKQKMLIDLANSKGGPLEQDEVNRILDPFSPLNKPVDPNTVVEKSYARSYIGSLKDAASLYPDSDINKAQTEVPQALERIEAIGEDVMTRKDYANKVVENTEAQLKQQSYAGYGADFVKNLFQPYVELKMRGLNPDVGSISGGLGLGTNLQAQADDLMSPFSTPDFETFKTKFDNIMKALSKDNLQLAHTFARYVNGLGTTERVLDDFFTAMALPDYAAAGKIGSSLVRKVDLANRTNTATKQLIKAAEVLDKGANPVAKAEALGDTANAAVTRASDNIQAEISGKSDPIKVATDESLVTMLNQDHDKVQANPGKLSREQTVRILDAYKASAQGILERITNTVRVNRISMAVATENAVRIIKEAVKEYYPGLRNALLDVSNPIYEPKSNTFWHDITFGNFGGDLFSNPKTAQNFLDLHGMKGEIVEGKGRITPPEIEALYERRAKLTEGFKKTDEAIERNRARMKDKNLSAEKRAEASEQVKGLTQFRRADERELQDIHLKLRGNKTFERVQQLQGEIAQLRSTNKSLRASLKKGKDVDNLKESIKWGEDQVKAKLEEAAAIREGKAEVLNGPTIEQQGVGWKIVVRRPLVETDKAVRDLLIRGPDGKLIPEAISTSSREGTLKSLLNGALGKWRGADDTLAINESIQRKIGTYSQSLFKEWAQEEAKYIRDLARGVNRFDPVTGQEVPWWRAKLGSYAYKGDTKQTFNEWAKVVDYARDARDPITGKPGYFFASPGELEGHYLSVYDRLPTFAEHQAYFAYTRMVEGDRIFREIAEFRNRARLGVEQHQISVLGADGKPVPSEYFDGVSRKTFPGGDDVMLVMSRRLGDEYLVNLGGSAVSPKTIEGWRKAVLEGKLRVIEIYAPEHTPLKNFSQIAGNEQVRYILTDAAETKPIDFNHVARRGGGHFEYDYDHYIKQATMYHQYEHSAGIKGRYRSVYTGDKTYMPIENQAMGNDVARKMNAVRVLIKDGKIDEARDLMHNTLPMEFDDFHKAFKPGRNDLGEITAPQYDINEPFRVVPRGKSILDIDSDLQLRYGKAFKNGLTSGSLNRHFSVAFNTEREADGLRTLADVGTKGNPSYKFAPAELVDPVTTLNRSLNRIVNSAFMDDYKIYAVEHWLREAEPHLELKNLELARSSPFAVFESANDKSAFRAGTNWETVQNLLSNRYKVKQFVGVPSAADTAMHRATQWLVDAAYVRFGPQESRNVLEKAVTLVPQWAMDRYKDPVSAARSLTFHAKLGMFNPAQLLVQMQTYAAIFAISPLQATKGSLATLLHQWSRTRADPAFINTLDKYASRMGWKPGHFKEAWETLQRTGFENVAGEHANLDTALKTDYIGNDLKGLLNAGTVFFREGEKATRLGGWYTAYGEFRQANPTKILTRDDIGKILQRADLLTINMSRASNSALHTGVFSLTTQFLSYQIRMAELFLGKRLGETAIERNMARGRLLLFYSLLYGAPSAVGLSGLPMSEAIRKEAIQRGYVMSDNWLKTAVMEGLPATMGAIATGTFANVGNRYGSPGFTQLRDALKTDASWYGLIAGAAGTTIANSLASLSPFWHAVGDMMNPNNKERQYPLKADDLVGLFKEISTVNQAWKVIWAMNTGKWISKNEGYIDDVSKMGAVFYGLTGLSPQKQDDMFLKGQIRKTEVESQKYILKEFIKEYHRYLDAAKSNNPNQAKDYYRRANALLEIGGYPIDKRAQALQIAAKGYRSAINDSDFSFFTKNVPTKRGDFLGIPMPFTTQTNIPTTRREQFRTETQIESGKR